jgi:vacuolar-type H+-ATPase subunit E/Vma4
MINKEGQEKYEKIVDRAFEKYKKIRRLAHKKYRSNLK